MKASMSSQGLEPAAAGVLDFWLQELGQADWYSGKAELDETIRRRFRPLWDDAARGVLGSWASSPEGALAFIIVTDQFSRNLFRNDARGFQLDRAAHQVAVRSIHHHWDMRIAEPARQFFYMPLMHSEVQMDQDRCVRMFLTRMPETGSANLLHARAHREIIRRFGRFPYRNAALGRRTRPEEQAFLDGGGYSAILKELDVPA